MYVSRLGGMSASTAKYQSRYQSGRGSASMMLGIGRRADSAAGRRRWPAGRCRATIATPKTTSRQAASGQNGTPSFFEVLLVLVAVRLRDRPARRASAARRCRGAARAAGAAPTNAKMSAGMRKTWMAKKRLSVAPPTVSPPRMKRAMRSPTTGSAPRLLGADDDRPGRVLVPAQELAGEAHAERAARAAGRPISQFISRGNLYEPEEEHLRHVHADHQHHRRGAEVVQAAQEAAERRVVRDEEERVVGLRRRGDVRERERDAAHDLDDEREQRRAAEHVPPARAARDGVRQDRAEQRRDADAIVDRRPHGPCEESLQHRVSRSGSVGADLDLAVAHADRVCVSGCGGGPAATRPSS